MSVARTGKTSLLEPRDFCRLSIVRHISAQIVADFTAKIPVAHRFAPGADNRKIFALKILFGLQFKIISLTRFRFRFDFAGHQHFFADFFSFRFEMPAELFAHRGQYFFRESVFLTRTKTGV